LALLVVSLFFLPVASMAQAPPAGAGRGKVVILPESFLRGYDPITVFFPGETGPKGAGPEDTPEKYVRMEPQAPGEYRWVDGKTLLFRPAVPWPALENFRVTVGSVAKTLHTLIVPPSRLAPADGARGLESLEEITLTFPEPLPKEKLARMATLEVRPLPGTGEKGARRLTSEDFAVKALERGSINDPAQYALRLKHPVGGGYRVLLRLKLSLEEKAPASSIQYSFSTRVPFRVVAVGCAAAVGGGAWPEVSGEEGYREGGYEGEYEGEGEGSEGGEQPYAPAPSGPVTTTPARGLLPLSLAGSRFGADQALDCGAGSPRIALQFSSQPAPMSLSAVKSMVHFSPAIPDLAFTQSGAFLYLSGKIERETLYRAVIQPSGLRDNAGRTLEANAPSEFHFYFPRQPSFLRWTQSEGMLERYGPQMFPLSGRGDGAVDLRIYKVDPLDRSFWPFPKNAVTINESQRPPGPGEEPEPGNSIRNYIDSTRLSLMLKLQGSPPVSRVVPLPLRSQGGATVFGLPLKEALAHVSGADQPGTYLLGIRRLNEQTTRDYVRIQVTDLCLTTVEEPRAIEFLVTSLRTGKPVAGASVRVEGVPEGSGDASWKPLISGVTDASGKFRYDHKAKIKADLMRIVAQSGGDTLVLLPSDPPYAFSNNHWFGPAGSWLSWLRNDPKVEEDESVILAHLLTERPVYRPEEAVYLKGYLRLRERGRLKYAPHENLEIVITDPSGKERNYPAQITQEGSFALTFQEGDLPTGEYKATLHDIKKNKNYGAVDWKMEAYRIPRFEVKLHGPDWVPMDREFTLTATASYYAGGKVVGQEARWRVTQYPYVHIPERREGWLFSSDERFSRGGRFEPPAAIEKSDKTDGSGATALTVNPALEIDARPRKYIFEVTVTGADDQTVTNVKEVKALPPFLLGLKVDRFIKGEKVIRPSFLALDGENKLLSGQEVTVRLLKRQWHSYLKETDFSLGKAKYVTDVVEELVSETKVVTGDEAVSLDLPVTEGGIYVVEASSRDALGRLQLVLVDLYVAGDEPLTWKKPQQNIFETATDKKEYAPGETAQLLIKSPFQQAQGLAVVEGPDGNSYHEFEVAGGKAVFELPIKNEYNPRIPVHFVLMRGRLPGSHLEGSLDLGKPTTMAATQWVKVTPEENRVEVKLEHPARALPGQKITVKIHLADRKGKPLPGEVTLALVDMAVLSLGKEKRLDPLPSFIKDTRSRITIRDTRNRVIGEIVTEESPGGGGSDEEGADLFGKVTVRKRFKTVPYYNPRILVDETGTAEVTFELSDDLTIFKVKAVACSGPDRFGCAQSTIAVRLPVIVQPALPRFARVGDRFSAGGIGRVVEGDGGPGRCQIEVRGATMGGDKTRLLQWVVDKPERLYFPMEVEVPSLAPGKEFHAPEVVVKLAVKRDADGAADAFETAIPILPDREPVVSQEFKRFSGEAPLLFPAMAETPRPHSVRQSVLVSDQEALLKMVSGLDYLYNYPHECTEQWVSRTLPAVALKDLYKVLEMKQSQEQTDELVGDCIEYLGKTLQPDGLYSFWPGGRGYVHLTAYVVEFLVEAKKSGFAFDPKLLDRPVAALKEALRSDYAKFIDGWAFTERAAALYALSLAGHFDAAYGSELAKKAKFADLYGETKILRAYNAGQPSGGAMTDTLRKDLWDGTVFKLRDGKEVFGGLQWRTTSWGGLILSSEITTQASLIRALYPKDSQNPKLKMVMDDLVAMGAGDGWGNTSTNAAALLALREVVHARREGASKVEFRAEFGDEVQTMRTSADHPTASCASSNPKRGRVVPGGPADGMFARLTLTYIPQAGGDRVVAKNEGFVTRLEILRVASDGAPPVREAIEKEGRTLPVVIGDVLEEHAQVINPEDRNFVVVVVPLAAGLEPMNPNLATAPKEALPSGAMTLEPSYAMYLDSEVRFYYETLPKGSYDFYFRVRASTPGSFTHPAARAEMMYQPQKRGNSPGLRIEVKEKAE
jgi:uncharacterized protein YfaS (alpha-2-macroglobulin family)